MDGHEVTARAVGSPPSRSHTHKSKKGKKARKEKKEKKEKKESRHKRKKSKKSDKTEKIAKRRRSEPEESLAQTTAIVVSSVAVAAALPVTPATARTARGACRPTAEQIAAARAGVVRRRAEPMKIMTQEEYVKKQSKLRKVYDPDTGRERLVKGDGQLPCADGCARHHCAHIGCWARLGEIIEEIVSRDRQREINAAATLGDGMSFQREVARLQAQQPP